MTKEHPELARTIVAELGQRLRAARLERNLSQTKVAENAGIGRVTLQRMEAGESPSLVNFVRVLSALGELDALHRLLPETAASPIDEVERRGRQRQRAGSTRRSADVAPRREGWRWGDEDEAGQA